MRNWSSSVRAAARARVVPVSGRKSFIVSIAPTYRASYFERAERRKSVVLVNWIMPVFSHRVPVTFTATSVWRRNASDISRRR